MKIILDVAVETADTTTRKTRDGRDLTVQSNRRTVGPGEVDSSDLDKETVDRLMESGQARKAGEAGRAGALPPAESISVRTDEPATAEAPPAPNPPADAKVTRR